MNRKYSTLIVLVLMLIVFSSCTYNKEAIEEQIDKNTTLLEENSDLIKSLEEREEELTELKTELEEIRESLERKQVEMFPPSITYDYLSDVGFYVFIDHEIDIKMLPYDNAQRVNVALENSLVKVLDKAQVQTLEECENDRFWYYVEITVYDTPLNTKGWIRVEETLPYTAENQSKVLSPVRIKDGVEICEDKTPLIDDEYVCSVSSNEGGRIIEFKDGKVCIMAVGGRNFWVKEENIMYPEIND